MRAFWCGCALVGALLGGGHTAGGAPPEPGVLLLRNGHVLAGQVVRTGDYYSVDLPGGGSLRIPATQVDLACRDLAEAYRVKLAALQAASPQERLDLAEWSLRHGLPAEAAEQLLAAARLDPGNPRLAHLERKLLALAHESAKPVSPPVAPAERPAPAPAEEPETAISPAALSNFTNGIQPLLLNRCGTATCHGGTAGGGFRLVRSPFGPLATQRMTRRNLAAVMGQVNRDAPEKSRLLTVPKAAHGTSKGPIFNDRDLHQWQALADWAAAASGSPETSLPEATALSPSGEPRPALPHMPPEIEGTRPSWLANPAGPLPPSGRPAPLASGAFEPRDPFDPEIFHRLTAEEK
jgi:hypothetical protein